jgi:RHS repeat-associated protein
MPGRSRIKVTVDTTGTVVGYDDYYPYGLVMTGRSLTASEDGRYKFTGKERDASDGLDYFGARYYDQWRGGWDQVDPLSDNHPGESPYVYCSGNPVCIVDDDGMEGHWETGPDGNPIWVLDPVVVSGNDESLRIQAAQLVPIETFNPTEEIMPPGPGISVENGNKIREVINGVNETLSDANNAVKFGIMALVTAIAKPDITNTPPQQIIIDLPKNLNAENKNVTDKIGKIAQALGVSQEAVKRAIEKIKRDNLGGGGNGNQNPDVVVDIKTGEVYPKAPNGKYGDSIGDIHNYLH